MDKQRIKLIAGDAAAGFSLVLRESVRSFGANRSMQTAATLAFYGFLSLMPLLLVAILLLAGFMESSERALAAVQTVVGGLFPAFNDQILQDLVKLTGQKAWGFVGVVVLLWSMTPFARSVRSALQQIFKLEGKAHFLKDKLADLAAVLALLVLFLALTVLHLYFNLSGTVGLWGDLLSLLVGVLFLVFFYAVFSPRGTRLGPLLAGAVAASLLLAVMRPLFSLMLQYNPDYGYAFGSVKAIFLILIWVYYTFAAILFGAEAMANTGRREALLLRGYLMAGQAGAAAAPGRLAGKFTRNLAAGEVLFEDGAAGSEMFYIVAGRVAIEKGGRVLRELGAGEYFGEMSMLLGAARTARVVAKDADTRLVAISQDNFDVILRENPRIVQSILKEMAARLKQTSERVALVGSKQ